MKYQYKITITTEARLSPKQKEKLKNIIHSEISIIATDQIVFGEFDN